MSETNESADIVTAALIVIGDEILSGRTKDKNIGYIADHCSAIGIQLREVRIVADEEDEIVAAVNTLRAKYTYVFTTGGIGPTHDDITAACVAKAFGVELVRDRRAEAMLRQHYRPEDVNAARLKMADVPAGATLIENPVSKAPGFQLDNVFVLPGVPRIMQAMFDGIEHRLTGGQVVLSVAVAAYIAEGVMAEKLRRLQDTYTDIEIGSYPFVRDGRLGVSVVLRGADAGSLDAAADDLRALIRSLGAEPVEDRKT